MLFVQKISKYTAHYFTEDGFLMGLYEDIEQITEYNQEDCQEEDIIRALDELHESKKGGEIILKEIREKKNLLEFENRINDYSTCDKLQKRILELAKGFFALSKIEDKLKIITRLFLQE